MCTSHLISLGRTHQIRLHAAHVGISVLNDDFYGHLFTHPQHPYAQTNLPLPIYAFASFPHSLSQSNADADDDGNAVSLPAGPATRAGTGTAVPATFSSAPAQSSSPSALSQSPRSSRAPSPPPEPVESSPTPTSFLSPLSHTSSSRHLDGHSSLRLLSCRVRFLHPLTSAEVDVCVPPSLLPLWTRPTQ